MLSLLVAVPAPALAKETKSFDWSGNSDVYVERVKGRTFANDRDSNFLATGAGWGYRFGDSGVYVNAFARKRDLSGISAVGTGLGLRGSFWRWEAGPIDEGDAQGGYTRLGLDVLQVSHLLVQANVQLEAFSRERASASAGVSVHVTDLNTVVPVLAALLVLACYKGCDPLKGLHSSSSSSDEDKKKREADH